MCLHVVLIGRCRPVWQRFDNTNANGAVTAINSVTEADCLSYCASLSDCIAVDVNWAARPMLCWIHATPIVYRNHYQYGVTHFQLITRCGSADTPSTTTSTTTTTSTSTATPSTTTSTTTPSTTAGTSAWIGL